MKNLLRALIYQNQVSLTIVNTTEMVQKGMQLHNLARGSAHLLGKALSLMTFMSACLKEEKGEISLSLKGDYVGEIAVSGNRQLNMRGYILNTTAEDPALEEELLGGNSYLTIIRDDGYNRPFVGACGLPKGGLDAGFEEYFRISEQLPTRLCSIVEFDETGVAFAGVIAVQPLPFAEQATLDKVAELPLSAILQKVKNEGTMSAFTEYFSQSTEGIEERKAGYKCNCSRRYLTRVLVSLGEEQMRQIIREDGAVRVHCHYCSTDYEFTDEDADHLFPKGT